MTREEVWVRLFVGFVTAQPRLKMESAGKFADEGVRQWEKRESFEIDQYGNRYFLGRLAG